MTYGYRRICALLNRKVEGMGMSAVNHKRVYRIIASEWPAADPAYREAAKAAS